jgi:hypothetical protein
VIFNEAEFPQNGLVNRQNSLEIVSVGERITLDDPEQRRLLARDIHVS